MAKILTGLVIISLGILTIIITSIPIVWIGAFLWGGRLVYSGLKQFGNNTNKTIYAMPPETDNTSVVFTCGQCGHKTIVPRGKGRIKIKCQDCTRESTVST